MSGIERAPVYPDMPAEPLSNAQVESLVAWQSIDEHRQLVEEILGVGTDQQYRLSEADLEARSLQMAMAKEIGHTRSRSVSEIGKLVLATVKQMEDEVRGQTVLDIGSGFGRFGESLARNAKAKVTHLDRDVDVLRKIRKGQIVQAEGTELPFADETFDKVFSTFSSVHWAENPLQSVKAIDEAIRVTKVGGSTVVLPLIIDISQRRRLLPAVLSERQPDGQFLDVDRYVAVWSLQDLTLIKSLFNLAEERYVSITWSNHLAETYVPGISQEVYAAVIDKDKSIPDEEYGENEDYARQFMPK